MMTAASMLSKRPVLKITAEYFSFLNYFRSILLQGNRYFAAVRVYICYKRNDAKLQSRLIIIAKPQLNNCK